MQASTFFPFANVAFAAGNRNPVGQTGQSGTRGPGGTGRAETNRDPQVKSFAKSLENAAQKASVTSDEDVINTAAAAIVQGPEANANAGLAEMLAALLQALGLSGSGEIPGETGAVMPGQLSASGLSGQGPSVVAAPEIKRALLKLLDQLRQGGQLTLTADSLQELELFLKTGSELPANQFMGKLADILGRMALSVPNNPEALSGNHNGGSQAAMDGGKAGNTGGPEAQNARGNDLAAKFTGIMSDNPPGSGKAAGNTEKAADNSGAAAADSNERAVQSGIKAAEVIGEADGAGEAQADGGKPENGHGKNSGRAGEDAFRKLEATGQKVVTDKAESGKGTEIHEAARQETLPNYLLTRMTHTPVKDAGHVNPVQARLTNVIFGQIVQKAKLVELPGMSELQIRLKPDFLGKLNLSIITENGVITAKFSAESYRVKEVIEANLNILKDALAEQGVKVDQLVVDVGTQRDYGGLREREAASYNRPANRRGSAVAGDDEVRSLFEQAPVRGAGGDLYGSTVDFMA